MPQTVTLPDDAPVIKNFAKLMDEISYSWESQYHLQKGDGYYWLNKLAIGPYWLEYKGHYYRLEPGVWEKLEQFYKLLNEP